MDSCKKQSELRPPDDKNNLYYFIDETKLPIIYDDIYNISFWGLEKLHPFDSCKWGKIIKILADKSFLKKENIIKPREASQEDLLEVHTETYLKSLTYSINVAAVTEVPPVAFLPNRLVQTYLLKPLRFQTGGTVLAARVAVERGWSINIGGGFHHCSSNEGGGFCAYADITLAIKRLLSEMESVKKVMIVDLDAHQGNGHERDFMDDERVFIMDVYNAYIYPHDTHAKRAINRCVELTDHTEDPQYLSKVERTLEESLDVFHPDFVLYNAGTDILKGDPLGRLDITEEGVIERDKIVFSSVRKRNIPLAMVTSGGYQRHTANVIANSILNLKDNGLLKEREDEGKLEQ